MDPVDGDTVCYLLDLAVLRAADLGKPAVLVHFRHLTLIVGALACPKLLSKFGKRDLCLAGCVLAVLAQQLLFLDSHSFTMLFAVSIVRAIGQAPITAVIFGMMGDVVEYGQWKFGIRQESLIFGCSVQPAL